MKFNDQVKRDIDNVFLNLDEFAEIHRIEGKEIPCIITDDKFIKMNEGQILGMIEADMLIIAKIFDLPANKSTGSFLNVDGKELIIESWINSAGIAEITLRQNRTM